MPILVRIMCACIFAAIFGITGSAFAKTAALVVGNNDYEFLPDLKVAVADAEAHCAHLKDVRKFDSVSCHFNVTKREMDRAVLGFLSQLQSGDTAMVVFAGHGVQLNPSDSNTVFLLPTDLDNKSIPKGSEEWTLRQYATQFNDLRRAIQSRDVRLSVYVMDNCRDNPLNTGGTRGLSLSAGMGAVPADRGEFIFFSASEGEVAVDRLNEDDKNSPFTTAFLKSFIPKVPLVSVANTVEREVIRLTSAIKGSVQRPRYDDNVEGPGCIEGLGLCTGSAQVSNVNTEVAAALVSRQFTDLIRVVGKSVGHPRHSEVQAQLALHREIDRQQTLLNLETLEDIYGRLIGHPRREEVRELIQRSILFNTCIELQRYGWPCTFPQTRKSTTGAKVAAVEPDVVEPQKAEPKPKSEYEVLSAEIDVTTLGAFSLPLIRVQDALATAGHYTGRIDGLNGPGTRRSIKSWRESVESSVKAESLSPTELIVLLKQVSEKSPQSKALLGLFHAQGIGFEKDIPKGKKMLEQAADAGFGDAKNWLSQLEGL